MKILYFTATGNSLHIAKSIAQSLKGELLSIPQMIKEGRFEFTDEKIGLLFPLYGYGVPSYIVDFIKRAKFNTNYLFGISTFGVYSGAVATHLMDVAKEAGHHFSYVNTIKMVDNYLPGFNMAKEGANEGKKGTEERLETIKSDIANSKEWIIPENFLRKLSFNIMHSIKKPVSKKQLKLHIYGEGIENYVYTDNNCTGCGLCANVCPVNNIVVDKENKTISLKGDCFGCFSCLHNCPQNNIHIKGEVSSDRYRNSNITLAEIVKSNS
ncbi:MAG: EFR1 family ferrodoxin [Spirochaetales bacterium]|nr:EFR1 family ferrodoxin [Spirochaetales bacterium]